MYLQALNYLYRNPFEAQVYTVWVHGALGHISRHGAANNADHSVGNNLDVLTSCG